jgi:hypothetical protein
VEPIDRLGPQQRAHSRIGRKISLLDGPLAGSSGTAVQATPHSPHKTLLLIDWHVHTVGIPSTFTLPSFDALTALTTHIINALRMRVMT